MTINSVKKFFVVVLVLTIFCTNLLAQQQAEAVPSNGVSSAEQSDGKTVEWYLGGSIGWDYLMVKRTEQLTTVDNHQFSFSQNKSRSANGIAGKAIVGFLWTIPDTAFVLSPEVYWGRINTQITVQESTYDTINNASKQLQSTLRHIRSMGLVLRGGFYLSNRQNDFLYVLIGFDKSQFENKYTFSSTDYLTLAVPSTVIKQRKWSNAPVFGFGFERKFNAFKVGIDLRYIAYPNWRQVSQKNSISSDQLALRYKPRVITTSLTFCYMF